MKHKRGSIPFEIALIYERAKFFPDYPRFTARSLIKTVKFRLQLVKKEPFDGTILRTLRRMRQRGELDYDIISKSRALYKWRF